MQLLSFQILLFVFWVLQVSVQNILLRMISFAVGGYSKLDFLAPSGILEACIREKTIFCIQEKLCQNQIYKLPRSCRGLPVSTAFSRSPGLYIPSPVYEDAL